MKRRGPGRPKLPKAERKEAIFSVRLSPEERAMVEAAAQSMGLKAAAWARLALADASAASLLNKGAGVRPKDADSSGI